MAAKMYSQISQFIDRFSNVVIPFLRQEVLYSTVPFAIILGLTVLLKRASLHWLLGLWVLVLIRLVLPLDLSFSFGVGNLLNHFALEGSFFKQIETRLQSSVFKMKTDEERVFPVV